MNNHIMSDWNNEDSIYRMAKRIIITKYDKQTKKEGNGLEQRPVSRSSVLLRPSTVTD